MAINFQYNTNPAKKKAFEVCYALFRVASKSRSSALSKSIEQKAIKLLDIASGSSKKELLETAENIAYLLRAGASVGMIASGNAEIILREIENLKELVPESHDSPEILDPEIEAIFSMPQSGKEKKKKGNPANVRKESGNPAIDLVNSTLDEISDEIRQRRDTILGEIRKSGNCRIKELQDSLQNVSERTIRYDLEVLINDGIVERIGNGPATYYRIKDLGTPGPSTPEEA
ncbi:MAG: hypothetical protein A2946_00880 [Candidatus Liptonbacteria bacterium RIFCSPLOWO2_01_FULL_53_13]|uniref:HTH deoR-type domain-containing protein n=1 Tax=Candidatus Liptonbacteria bacterium RIFCSPLOWO2_01_FULL_53_13 TaxID=1798651 RepID=A0A1G2CGI5_9BACT|nr:MAG: hypothetical protein A2946_00880 [Candidatus Liptonbacteria bacterium RIFCSPLOWO2_01_FULL_53_13]